MAFSGDAWLSISNSYQAWVNARYEITNYDINREFAIFAPNCTITQLDGSLQNLQQLRQNTETCRKTARRWLTYLNYERFDEQGQQAIVILFWRDEILFEYPSDVENKILLVPRTNNCVLQHTWLHTAQGWKLVSELILHQAISDGQPEYISPNPSTTALLQGSTVWSSAVRLETGDIIAFEKIFITSSGGYLYGTASFHNNPLGGIEGSQQGNHFGFRLVYNSGTNSLQNRDRTEIVFDGNMRDNQAAGTVQFIDEYRKVFKGTFTLVPYNFNATAPTPSVGDSFSNAIEGAWKGEFLPKYHPSYPLTLNLNHQCTPIVAGNGGYYNGANIVGTGTIGGKAYQVEGTIAGSSYNLEIGDSSTRLNISGQVSQDVMVGRAYLNTGEEVVPGVYKRFGEIKLTR